MSDLLRPVESVRATPGLIWVRFSDDSTAEVSCLPALIGNPIAREIEQMARWMTEPRPLWRPPDAGEHAPALEEVLGRIQEPWLECLDIEPGWYPIAAQAHRELLVVDADYEVSQVKQKFGELRIGVWHEDPAVRLRLFAVTGAARERSTRTCEWCGGGVDPLAELHRRGWVMRLCPSCATFRDAWEHAWREAAGKG